MVAEEWRGGRYKLITSKSELIGHREGICNLFEKCFNRRIDMEIWNWMYIMNPIGDPVVSLCFNQDGEVIGHYGAIPVPIIVNRKNAVSLISVGSMVDAAYRKYGLFVRQAQEVYSYAQLKYEFVYGFPNKMALPARKKRLSWIINESDYVALVSGKQLIDNDEYNALLGKEMDIELDTKRNNFLEWRLSKPGSEYILKNGSVFKGFDDGFDILYIADGYEKHIDHHAMYYVLCDGSIESMRMFKAFDYPFGYYLLKGDGRSYSFRKNLIMSDVF